MTKKKVVKVPSDGNTVAETTPTKSPIIETQTVDNNPLEVIAKSDVRRLRINRIFQGARTQEQALIPGVYFEDDGLLYGLASWLVENAYAEWVV